MLRKGTRASDKQISVKTLHRSLVSIKTETGAQLEGPGTHNGGWGPGKT